MHSLFLHKVGPHRAWKGVVMQWQAGFLTLGLVDIEVALGVIPAGGIPAGDEHFVQSFFFDEVLVLPVTK